MQLNHKDEYEKLCNENEVDKSSILKTMKGSVFMIEVVDNKHQSEFNSEEDNIQTKIQIEEPQKEITVIDKPKVEMLPVNKTDNAYPKKITNRITKESHMIKQEGRNRMLSRENSYVKQSSMLSEISQSLNANNLADYFDKNGFT